jgi:hypothetical protein
LNRWSKPVYSTLTLTPMPCSCYATRPPGVRWGLNCAAPPGPRGGAWPRAPAKTTVILFGLPARNRRASSVSRPSMPSVAPSFILIIAVCPPQGRAPTRVGSLRSYSPVKPSIVAMMPTRLGTQWPKP